MGYIVFSVLLLVRKRKKSFLTILINLYLLHTMEYFVLGNIFIDDFIQIFEYFKELHKPDDSNDHRWNNG